MKSVNPRNALQACAVVLLATTMLGVAQDRITLLSPAVLSMQTPIGEARTELPVGTVIENGALVNGGIQIEHGPFTGWIPIECAKLPAPKAKAEEVPSTPSPTPSPTSVPIIEPIKSYEQPENSLWAFLCCWALRSSSFFTRRRHFINGFRGVLENGSHSDGGFFELEFAGGFRG